MLKYFAPVVTFFIFSTSFADQIEVETYPSGSPINIVSEQNNDSVSITIENLSLDPINNFFITVLTDQRVNLVDYLVDNNPNHMIETDIEDGTVYYGYYTTRFVFNTVNNNLTLTYQTSSTIQLGIYFSGTQASPFFGIITPVNSDCCIGNRGNIDYSENEETDIVDLLYLVSYMFDSPAGPAPVCTSEADLDASGEVDISDLLYLVDFMFASPPGAAPLPCN